LLITCSTEQHFSLAIGGGETMRQPLTCLLLLAGVLFSTQVSAQEFPSKPVHIMVGAAPGGLIDLFARTYGTKLQERSGQPVLVENNSVATGTIGAGLVAKSAPDGYTLIMGHPANMTIWPIINPNLPYDTRKDFAPIAGRTSSKPPSGAEGFTHPFGQGLGYRG
jgi:tripartite-type tricarboxylate transporter receptor subunit TctC